MVLTYHHVVPNHLGIVPLPVGTYVSQKTFQMQMKYISKHFKVLSLTEFCDGKLQPEKLKKGCLITFDDGWQDNYIYAFEALKDIDLSAAIFLPTKFIEEKNYWSVDKIIFWLIRLMFSDSENKGSAKKQLDTLLQEYNLKLSQNIKKVSGREVSDLIEQLKNMDSIRLKELSIRLKEINDLYKKLDNDPIDPTILNWNEIDKLSSFGIEFGSHTHSHVILTQLYEKEIIKKEIKKSREILEQHFQKPIQSLAYPDGKWNVSIAKMIKEAGYLRAFTNTAGYYDGNNPYSIPRINIHEDVTFTKALFACQLSGIFEIVRSI